MKGNLFSTAATLLRQSYSWIEPHRRTDSDNQINRAGLAGEGIFKALCPQSPQQLKHLSRSWKFKRLQRHRPQTEGRIGILKNVFLGQPIRSKGFEHRQLTVT